MRVSKLFLKRFGKVFEWYWNNKWPKNQVLYNTRGNYKMDVRNLILTKSYILQPIADRFKHLQNDDKALRLLKLVINKLTYKSDSVTRNTPEYWENPEVTWQRKTGDCEDGALLLISLMRMAGVPAYRVKLRAGDVRLSNGRKGGHGNIIYLSEEENEWFPLDWCFYPVSSVTLFNQIPDRKREKYLGIWWTGNDLFTWAQRDTIVKFK